MAESTKAVEAEALTPAAPGGGSEPGGAGATDQAQKPFSVRRLFSFDGARSVPLIVAIVLMWLYFNWATHGVYLGGQNISYMLVDAVQTGVIAVGVVIILLLAEIDLSLGSLVVLCGCGSALIMQESWAQHLPDFERMLVGVAACLAIGAICGFWNGFWVSVVRVPSFVVTLGGLFIFLGITLLITNSQTILVNSAYFNAFGGYTTVLNNGYLANIWGNEKNVVHLSWGMVLAVAVGTGYFIFLLRRRRDRTKNSLSAVPLIVPVLKALGLTVVAVAVAEKLDYFFGVPIPVVVFLALLLLFAYILGRSRFGRHIYAAGGNPEAARRAGIPVQRLRWSAFVISGTLAGVGAVIATARYGSISAGALDQSLLLNVIAAAVIGGCSLFGGRGTVWAALLGALILSSVQYGVLATLSGSSSSGTYWTYVVKGLILMAAVTIDTIAVGGRSSGVGLWASTMTARLPGLRRS